MDANEFIAQLKANNTAKDITDLVKVFDEYKVISVQLQPKDRAPFSLNILCVLCRNLDKAPVWRDAIDNKALLTLSIDCVRETRAMLRADRVKILACIYHIHRHVVRQTGPINPELVLKISFMPFEVQAKHLLGEYSKTYWNILVDRLSYIERLRNIIPIVKLLPKLTEDIVKIIEIYDTVLFCSSIIVILVKKLHLLYNEKNAKELNQMFKEIFMKLSEKDMKPFKKLVNKEIVEIYVKLSECLYVIAENASKTDFKDSPLDSIVRTCISIVGHSPDIFHCLQTFYSNSFCSILTTNTHLTYSETVLNGLLVSMETTEKLGYGQAMLATYPFLNQFLRLYIESNVANYAKKPWKDNFNIQIQEICLKLIQILMKRLKNCNQLIKCDSCQVKTGLHDSLRLSFLIKHFIGVPISQKLLITDTLPLLIEIINDQYIILTELNQMGCQNHEKCFRKQQTDIHNTAITLNKAEYYEFSVKLFNIYLNYEISTTMTEQKNISRALYNKSICELDSKLYESALIDAFLSLVFASDGLSSDKYMSLVMDIKAKELKSKPGDDDDESKDFLQTLSVLDACAKAFESELYTNIKPHLVKLRFSELLKHEFQMYAKLWPSVTPIGGVWRSLLELSKSKYTFTAEDKEAMCSLYEVIVETPTVVRNITGDHFKHVITELLEEFDVGSLTPDLKVIYSSLLFLNTEFELAAASQKYGWKNTETTQNSDPESVPMNRTIPQEYEATKSAIRAVNILAHMSPDFDSVSNRGCLQNCLQIYQVFVQLLLQLSRDVEGLQLARVCCLIADCVGDKEAFVRNAGTLLYHGCEKELQSVVCAGAVASQGLGETALIFLCDASIYYSKCGSVGVAARLAQMAQAQILKSYENNSEIKLDLAVGRLLEAQTRLCRDSGPSVLSAVNSTHRHYLSIVNTGTKWHTRRLRSLTLGVHIQHTSVRACRVARALRLWRRARAAAATHAARASCGAAATRASLAADTTDVTSCNDAQINIDNRIKYALGLPSAENQPHYATADQKQPTLFAPKQEVETMLDSLLFRRCQTSPSIPCPSVPAFKIPDWFNHSASCDCHACYMPVCSLLACRAAGLEAAMYFRANENAIARNYFNGVRKMMHLTEEKLKGFKKKFLVSYEEFIVNSVMKVYWERYRKVKVEILIELAFFELKSVDYDVADELIVEIHEIIQEMEAGGYMMNEIMNLMTCSAQLRRVVKKPEDNLETEFENLRLSPLKFTVPPKTPITKPTKPPKITKMIVKDEEIPKKRKVIKLNLDEGAEDEVKVTKSTKPKFKLPVEFSAKHILEAATPRTRSKPLVLLTQPSQDTHTPRKDTTVNSTPEQFFTPMTSVKTYKKSVQHNIVKNLEQEFFTPSDKENKKEGTSLQVPRSRTKEKKSLKRATSPGKLCKEARVLPRASRLKKPVNFSLEEDDRR